MTESWSRPTQEEVERLLVSIAEPSLRSLFFSELENPEWIAPLRSLGVFSQPPEPDADADGFERPPPWPEGEFLTRVAADRPQEVADILKSIVSSRNPWVQRTIVSATSKLPVNQAKMFVNPIAKMIRTSTDWLNVEEAMTVANHLSEAGERAAVRKLLNALFDPMPGLEEKMVIGSRTRVRGAIDDYYYIDLITKAVPILCKLNDIEGLKLAATWIRRASRIASGDDPEHASAFDGIWRPSIAPHAQNSGMHEITDALIDTVRDTAIELGRQGNRKSVIDFLNDERSPFLMRRIAIEVAAQIATDGDGPSEFTSEAFTLLMDPSLMGISSRPEYSRLALALLPLVSDDQRASWVRLVRSGSWQGTDEEIRRLSARGEKNSDEVTVEDIVEIRRHLLHRFLQPLTGSLPSPLDQELASMEAEWGKLTNPEFGSYMESFTGPTSPKSKDQIAAMSAEDLAAFLRTWEPPNDHSFGPSIEGLSRELAEVAATRPSLFEAIADELPSLGRSYVRAALSGWAKAIQTGFTPTERVWQLVRQIVQQPVDSSRDSAPSERAIDQTLRRAQGSALDLIAAAVADLPRPAPAETVSQLWELLMPLLSHVDPTVDHEAKYGGSNMDPLTLSLNSIRPNALRAAIRLASASHDEKTRGDLDPVESDILQSIASHVDDFNDPSLAVAAVIGEGLGQLWNIDPTWISSRQDDLFAVLDEDDARRSRSDVIVSVALRAYQTGADFMALIGGAVDQVLSERYSRLEHIDGWRGSHSTADAAAHHILSAYLLQIIELDDANLRRLFSDSPIDVVSEAIGHVGWQIMRAAMDGAADTIPEEYLERGKILVDWRVGEVRAGRTSSKELARFYWWIKSDLFSPSWWLPILQLGAGNIGSSMIGGPLADAASSEPTLAVEVFQQLYGALEGGKGSYDLVRHASRLMATALLSNNEAAIAGANQLKDTLGRQGHFQVLQELENLLASESDSADDR